MPPRALIIAAAIILFVWNRLPVIIVAMGVALALYATGVLTLNKALAGLGDPSVIFIASLFVVSAGLEMAGITAWAGQLLIAKAGADSRARLLILTMLLVSLLTALISLNGAVAALLPVVAVMAVRLKRAPSQLLMPLVFSAHAGSMLALTGTPVNVLVSNASVDAGLPRFGFFEFTLVGVPLLLGTMAIIVLFGQRLLPERRGPSMPSKHARTLVEQYGLSNGMFQGAQHFPLCRPARKCRGPGPISATRLVSLARLHRVMVCQRHRCAFFSSKSTWCSSRCFSGGGSLEHSLVF